MENPFPEIRFQSGKLMAVPAAHYRVAFACHVNAICSDERYRPDAIAVELGPGAVSEISNWLVELGMGRRGENLPTMLGLVQQKRRIHPKFKEKAIYLQKSLGLPIHEIPLSILAEELGYAAFSMTCLSPTDSIIEAIRCAIEQSIPVYGIDLEESASIENLLSVTQNPLKAFEDLNKYTRTNQHAASDHRDQHLDHRREQVMVARLKYLFQRYNRILFTGGIAHWIEIQRLLMDPAIKAASYIPDSEGVAYLRVLVHPALAARNMDLFPSVGSWFEKYRLKTKTNQGQDPLKAFQNMFFGHVETAYSTYFSHQKTGLDAVDCQKDREKLSSYEHFLGSLCAISQQYPPHFAAMLEAADAVMSPQFTSSMMESLLTYGMNWASPNDFPELPLIGPASADKDGPLHGERQTARFGIPRMVRGDDGNVIYDYTAPFTLSDTLNGDTPQFNIRAPWFLSGKHGETFYNTQPSSGLNWNWPPCEYLLHGTAYEAAKIVMANASTKNNEAFEGSLMDGIDVKTTLRSMIKGENKLYVHRKNNIEDDFIIAAGNGLEPTVFIFENPAKEHQAGWHLGAAGGTDMRQYIEASEREHFDQATKQTGSVFVGSVYFSDIIPPPDKLAPVVDYANKLVGYTTFGNPCAHVKQSVKWLKATRYTACPIIHHMAINPLFEFYQNHHHVALNRKEWASTLVRLAIPYANNRVVIVAHDGFSIDSITQKEAHARHIQLNVLPLSVFPTDRIRQIRIQYFVNTGNGGLRIQRQIEERLGPKDKYLDMLPPQMQAQVATNN